MLVAFPGLLFAIAGGLAVADWIAVATGRRRAEAALKPAVMLALIAAALATTPASPPMRWLVAGGLVLGLAGDVFLLPVVDRFRAGLASFLAGHVLYAAAFAARGTVSGTLLPALVACGLAGLAASLPILSSLRRKRPALVAPVLAYIAAIAVMLALAVGTRLPVAIAGAALFALSDLVLALDRFVRPLPGGRVGNLVLYHSAQAALVLSLVET